MVLYIYDLSGKAVYTKNKCNDRNKIDITKYPPGTYILKIILDNDTSEWKVIKE